MSTLFKELTMIMSIISWLQKLETVSKQMAHKFDMERFNLKHLNDMKVKEQYSVKISNRFAALENLDDLDISGAWESKKR
jgi:hypothetical protein